METAANFSSVLRSTTNAFASCLALLASSCLTPPAARALNPSPPNDTPAVPAHPPQEFVASAADLLATTKLGWNLGNSLDVPEGETAWGNPKITPELLNAVK